MASITGPEIAALIDEGCLIGSAEDFSNDLLLQTEGFPESVRERVVCRHWIRGVFLIVKVVRDRHREPVQLKLDSDEEIFMLVDQLSEDAQTIHLRGRKFSIIMRGPLRHLQASSSPAERREAIRALKAPVSLRLKPDTLPDCGEDGVIAVNLTRTLDLATVRSPLKAHWKQELADVLQTVLGPGEKEPPFEASHFIGGPCEEAQVAACLVLADNRILLIQDQDCLHKAVATANSLALGGWQALDAEGQTATGVPWFRELSQLQRHKESDQDDDDDEEEEECGFAQAPAVEGGEVEPAAKRQKQASENSSTREVGVPIADNATASAGSSPKTQVRLLVMWGYAGWSRCQLMGEIARGSWGLCRAVPEDVVPADVTPADLWRGTYPRLIFAPKNEMSESYGGEVPEEEERRRQLRHMAIFHEILHGRLGPNRPPTPELAEPPGEEGGASPGVDIDDIDDDTLERVRARVDGIGGLESEDSEESLDLEDDDEVEDSTVDEDADDEDSEVAAADSSSEALEEI